MTNSSLVERLTTRETLRLCTAGSVDDGKSTFVGRLLYDTKSVLADQVESMERSSADRGFDGMDLSLLVDGLRAEREQGITIDVAYRYFATDKRTFILADTPGHVQYTRNTVTGMSTSQAVVLLIDARHGVVEQTRRHLNVAALLGVRHVVLAVNKIDLVDYDEQVFRDIESEFNRIAARLDITDTTVVPISALKGDNVVERSATMEWYTGPTVLEVLETVPVATGRADDLDFRFPIQYVIREHASDYRGYAGRVKAGHVAVGDEVTLLGGRTSTVTAIDTADGPLDSGEAARAGDSVVLRLADDIDLARGDLIAGTQRPEEVREFAATAVVLTDKELRAGQMVKLRYGAALVNARVASVERILDLDGVADVEAPESAALNDIAFITVQTQAELPVEDYAARGAVGNFLLIDQSSGNTLAAGFVGQRLR
ncbi:sulfate adenylyltransferase subunit 1 [Corynebacterium striatum]|uniref:sulfate adenylyltransferase subunit 1 n=1 Tax=Corynebacterium striatum TaxID=43770 RepID=UPI001026184B|nr:GTP-binding protein [Corynebacterium striatum]MDC7106322.1 GTP-binding protein [Corynebacterium striatum]VFB06314.1 sulfate adenylyltransferase subunit 1 / adenylylsulfate kinase [Corynebacterium striatum]HAT1276085.1 sulfate adenylyltransferase [Corynebacterium striatum]HAT1319678.1 sulfate adenylyltransferase [Corynebacterium striatum]HAT1408598.1 sulfate adenylyltransferase [Corynebacterium striatum]